MKWKESLKEYTTAALYYIFRIVPIKKKKAVFCNYNGKGFACNPKYLAIEMNRRGGWEIVWLVSDMSNSFPDYVKKVKYGSVRATYELATAGVWIDNQRKLWFHRKRKNQFFLETWHGAGIPMKKIGADNPRNVGNKPYERTSLHMNRIADLMISNSVACTEIFHRTFLYSGEILECGYPRNDILVNTPTDLKGRVYQELGISKQSKTVIYAPTYRNGRQTDMYRLDATKIIDAFKKKYGGDWKLVLRLHPTMQQKTKEIMTDDKNVINGSKYSDMHELLAVCDVLISDYSSVISEFAITSKPVFLYAEDINEYAVERDFYTDYYSLPFPIAESNEKLVRNILEYDEITTKEETEKFLEKIGMHEYGNASEVLVDRIEKAIAGR